MTAVVVCLAIFGLVSLVAWAALIVWVFTDVAGQERRRVEQQAAEASWRIHQQATTAFAHMLDAARESRDQEDQR